MQQVLGESEKARAGKPAPHSAPDVLFSPFSAFLISLIKNYNLITVLFRLVRVSCSAKTSRAGDRGGRGGVRESEGFAYFQVQKFGDFVAIFEVRNMNCWMIFFFLQVDYFQFFLFSGFICRT